MTDPPEYQEILLTNRQTLHQLCVVRDTYALFLDLPHIWKLTEGRKAELRVLLSRYNAAIARRVYCAEIQV